MSREWLYRLSYGVLYVFLYISPYATCAPTTVRRADGVPRRELPPSSSPTGGATIGTVDASPDIVPISRLRDEIAGVITRVSEDGMPIFITQHGRLTAVLLSRERYDRLLDLVAERDEAAAGDGERQHPRRRDRPVRGFPATRRRTHVDTLYGLVDPETAAFFAEQGIWTEDQGGPPPP